MAARAPPTVCSSATEAAADCRLHAEHREELPRHDGAGNHRRLGADADRRGAGRHLGHRDEAARALLPVLEVGLRHRAVAAAGVVDLQQPHDPIRIWIRQRPQQHAVDDAEDGGRGADAERQRHDRDDRKSRRANAGGAIRSADREADLRASAGRNSSRVCSFTCSTPPKRTKAWRRASSGAMPARMFLAVCCSMWNRISSSRPDSTWSR